MREVPCPVCHGARLKPEVLAVTIGGTSIAERVRAVDPRRARSFLGGIEWDERALPHRDSGAQGDRRAPGVPLGRRPRLPHACPAPRARCREARRNAFGSPPRSVRALSACSTCLTSRASACTSATTGSLIETLTRLRDLGNTLIVVEHDEDTIRTADWVVDIGPGAGEHGGEVVHSGTYADLLLNERSITGAYVSGRKRIPVPATRRPMDPARQITVVGAREHNLRDIDVTFPLGVFTAVTGVSGSGKSTLVNTILYTALANRTQSARGRSQGATPASTARTSSTRSSTSTRARSGARRGRTPPPTRASGTRCASCSPRLRRQRSAATAPAASRSTSRAVAASRAHGDGTLKIEMNFLPDVYVPCEVCKGARYNRETLEVHFKGKNVADVLNMPIEEAVRVLRGHSRDFATPVDARRRWPGLRQAWPTSADAVGGRGAARQARVRVAATIDGPHHLRA